MGRLPTVKIKHPSIEGDFMVINESDFDPERHERFEETAAKPKAGKPKDTADPGAGEGEKDAGSTAGGENGLQFPEGYRYEPGRGGYGHLYGPDGQLIEGPSKGKWQGEDGALQAARHHAEQHAGEGDQG